MEKYLEKFLIESLKVITQAPLEEILQYFMDDSLKKFMVTFLQQFSSESVKQFNYTNLLCAPGGKPVRISEEVYGRYEEILVDLKTESLE